MAKIKHIYVRDGFSERGLSRGFFYTVKRFKISTPSKMDGKFRVYIRYKMYDYTSLINVDTYDFARFLCVTISGVTVQNLRGKGQNNLYIKIKTTRGGVNYICILYV